MRQITIATGSERWPDWFSSWVERDCSRSATGLHLYKDEKTIIKTVNKADPTLVKTCIFIYNPKQEELRLFNQAYIATTLDQLLSAAPMLDSNSVNADVVSERNQENEFIGENQPESSKAKHSTQSHKLGSSISEQKLRMRELRGKLVEQLRRVDSNLVQIRKKEVVKYMSTRSQQKAEWKNIQQRKKKIDLALMKARIKLARKAELQLMERAQLQRLEEERKEMKREESLKKIQQMKLRQKQREYRLRQQNRQFQKLKKLRQIKTKCRTESSEECKPKEDNKLWRQAIRQHMDKYQLTKKQRQEKPKQKRVTPSFQPSRFTSIIIEQINRKKQEPVELQRQKSLKVSRVQNYSELVKQNFFSNMQLRPATRLDVESELPKPPPATLQVQKKQTVAQILGYHLKRKNQVEPKEESPKKQIRYKNYLKEFSRKEKTLEQKWEKLVAEKGREEVMRKVKDIQFLAGLKQHKICKESQIQASELYLHSLQAKIALLASY